MASHGPTQAAKPAKSSTLVNSAGQDAALDASLCYSALYIESGGAIQFKDFYGNTDTWANIPNGFLIPCNVTQVIVAGTTCSGIHGLGE